MSISIDDGSKKITLEVRAGETIADAARRGGIFLPMPCGGHGRCGKCAVMARGEFHNPGESEARLLERVAPMDGYAARIACMCGAANGEVVIPRRRNISVAGLTGDIPPYDGKSKNSFGIAADIGTTTISALLFSFASGEAIASAHEMNRQASYGADVLSRIDHSNRNGAGGLHRSLTSQLGGMMSGLAADAGIDPSLVTRVVMTGNTTMLHFLTGLNPEGIGAAPFAPASLFGDERAAEEIFPSLAGAELYIPPSITAYVGADITCGIISTEMALGAPNLLIDVGTNGEMALHTGSSLLCCSTAAGPAFEGASISMGMPAVSGAVSKVTVDGESISCVTIDGARPAGICGSGMISAANMMISAGVLDESGRIMESGHGLERFVGRSGGEVSFALGESGVSLTQKDIRNIQLAKASIAAGARVLLKEAGISANDVRKLYLSGGFGSTIDPAEAAGIGLIPAELADRAVASGNTALSGAAQSLFSRAARALMARAASAAFEISLSRSAAFMEEYVEQMPFGDLFRE